MYACPFSLSFWFFVSDPSLVPFLCFFCASQAWGRKKQAYYSTDTREIELESDDELAKDEEAEAIRMQKQKSKHVDAAVCSVASAWAVLLSRGR